VTNPHFPGPNIWPKKKISDKELEGRYVYLD